jgi:hypothetical protein
MVEFVSKNRKRKKKEKKEKKRVELLRHLDCLLGRYVWFCVCEEKELDLVL